MPKLAFLRATWRVSRRHRVGTSWAGSSAARPGRGRPLGGVVIFVALLDFTKSTTSRGHVLGGVVPLGGVVLFLAFLGLKAL